ncbi:MAG TPA: DUF1043 domain-containing protein [Idiomarina baltica]|jgi:uncharacterized membrane-anchored protein YhcB (DUF1043 family)|uniref:Z-ring associated protein G n=1 Tax=Idiomarina baltica TaxID=190892 RepID=A0A348WNH3_9GAMM|nr:MULTISPECIES: YhcB family protein [Idiomarina]MEC8925346.1 YhcB family protein [Pseudomonadota bacterium]KXS36554.1 MAG: hypothetical protein AWU56_177 [Idiomarina sp. T82-3]MBR37366.1 hypothetical protein [Idiomarina sp.]HAE89945.1 DUF1043 domain-containing protein [Idiomarina sp.]HAR56085.1 DUF1043 domain-containing protein [Idiomarina baltica]|tara:strand:+ start:770 stop:1210 length:441 start_codon:yes stop_codon:yes gene_type:complete
MDWLIGILLVAVGAIIGFFVARYLFGLRSGGDLEEQVEKSQKQLADYQREVAEHFATANALVEQLEETQDKLKNYLAHSADLLQKNEAQSDLPFFSEDTMRQLRVASSMNKDYRSTHSSEEANQVPKDYTDQRSGLFTENESSKRD